LIAVGLFIPTSKRNNESDLPYVNKSLPSTEPCVGEGNRSELRMMSHYSLRLSGAAEPASRENCRKSPHRVRYIKSHSKERIHIKFPKIVLQRTITPVQQHTAVAVSLSAHAHTDDMTDQKRHPANVAATPPLLTESAGCPPHTSRWQSYTTVACTVHNCNSIRELHHLHPPFRDRAPAIGRYTVTAAIGTLRETL